MHEVATSGIVHGHTLIEKIGEGHYGEVWRAEYMGHSTALKIFKGGRRRDQVSRETFAQYALGRLTGEDARFFPRVEHIDLDAEPPYARMELIDGTPLEDLLEGNPSMSLEERLAIGEEVLRALAAVHRNGFIHGDLSPRNILVAPDRRVRLIDVGCGAILEDPADIVISTTEEQKPGGVASPLYAAPERFKGGTEGCGKPSDIFSFGKLLYRMVTGDQPIVIKPVSLKFPALGTAWDNFLFRCLEERPEARFADGEAALAEYDTINHPEPAPGEYRAECPECKAGQTIPGGWAGERFDCRRCGEKLEVLFYDDGSRYATTAVVGGDPAPDILFIEKEASSSPSPSRTRKFCPACGGEIMLDAVKCRHCAVWVDDAARRAVRASAARGITTPPSFMFAAIFTFLSYFAFWLPGFILNLYYLGEAEKAHKRFEQEPSGLALLKASLWLFVYLPMIFGGGLVLFGLLGPLLLVLAA